MKQENRTKECTIHKQGKYFCYQSQTPRRQMNQF